MPLVDQAAIETYLGLSASDAARVARYVRPAERYLRDLKGGLWYDAMMSALPVPAAPGAGPDAAAPTIEILSPVADTTVGSPVLLHLIFRDDVAVTDARYNWVPDGETSAPYYAYPMDGLPASEVETAYLLGLPEGLGTLYVMLDDAAGNQTVEAVTFTVEGAALGEAEPYEFATVLPSATERAAAENAEALLALYYGLPQLNLQLDPDGGVLTTIWTTDPVTGARTQTQFAGSDRLQSLRADLLDQAKLLVMGGVRVERGAGVASTLLDGVEGFTAGGGGYFGII